MGTIIFIDSGQVISLRARSLIGRHPACDVHVDDPRVSGEHAALRWTGGAWELRDLGSTNGTFVGGRRLGGGERVVLSRDATVTLGGVDLGFVLADDSPPLASAQHLASGAVREASGGMLVLPDDDHPSLSLLEDVNGRWVAECDEGTRPVSDHEVLTVGGEGWLLHLPLNLHTTLMAEALDAGPKLESISLRFAVSRDEEHVEISVLHRGAATPLPSRSHHYLLVTLARARLEDSAASPAEQGWVAREQICKMLAIDENRLNVDIFRARKQLTAAGVIGASGIVERRPGSGQIRLGTGRVEVVRL